MSAIAPEGLPAPQTVAEAVASLHDSSGRMATAADRLLELAELAQDPPEMHPITLNPGNNGQYTAIDKATWPARSIGILNLSAVAVFIGIGGTSARPTGGAPFCPAGKVLILPARGRDIEIGADPALLGGNSAQVWVFRYRTLQPLQLST